MVTNHFYIILFKIKLSDLYVRWIVMKQKKDYKKPMLKDHGDLKTITQGGGAFKPDSDGPSNTPYPS